ncbi:MAG: hypothetical protein JWM59_4518 [Verrucomicrobiales bacterium]|nr:hypothetical protein [Verrucomicrobiales bacterium]
MKTTPLLTLLAALGLCACDKAEQESAKAKAKEITAETKAQAEGAIEKVKAAGGEAAAKAKEAMPGVIDKTKELANRTAVKTREIADAATDFTKEKLGIPETDGLLEGLGELFNEASRSVKSGTINEKAGELKARWNVAYAKAQANAETLAPEAKAKTKAFLEKMQEKWDALISTHQQ